MHRVIAGCETMYFAMSVSDAYLAATVNAAAVAKHHGVKAFINMSQMTVQIRVLLARKGGRRQILSSCAGSHCIGIFFSKLGEMAGELFLNVLRDRFSFDELAHLTAEPTDSIPVFHL
jgi:hypothetical protein